MAHTALQHQKATSTNDQRHFPGTVLPTTHLVRLDLQLDLGWLQILDHLQSLEFPVLGTALQTAHRYLLQRQWVDLKFDKPRMG